VVLGVGGSSPLGHPKPEGPVARLRRASSSIWQSNGLLIRRFGVRIPGGPPANPQVEGLSGDVDAELATAPPVYLPSETRLRHGTAFSSESRNGKAAALLPGGRLATDRSVTRPVGPSPAYDRLQCCRVAAPTLEQRPSSCSPEQVTQDQHGHDRIVQGPSDRDELGIRSIGDAIHTTASTSTSLVLRGIPGSRKSPRKLLGSGQAREGKYVVFLKAETKAKGPFSFGCRFRGVADPPIPVSVRRGLPPSRGPTGRRPPPRASDTCRCAGPDRCVGEGSRRRDRSGRCRSGTGRSPGLA